MMSQLAIAASQDAALPQPITTENFPVPSPSTDSFPFNTQMNVMSNRNYISEIVKKQNITLDPAVIPLDQSNYPKPSPSSDQFPFQARANIIQNREYVIDNYDLSQQNQTNIAANKNTIANNTATIGQNTTSIATHETTISQNTADIKGNTSAIADNKTAISENTTNMNSNFAALDKISYNNNGTLSFGSAGSAARASETTTIQLFDPDSASQSAGALNQEMLYNRSMLSNLDQRTTATNQQIQNLQWQYNDLSGTVDKQGKAISVNAAFAALPSGYMPDKNFIGIGVGHFHKHTGVAVGLTRSFDNGVIIQGRYGASGGTSVVSAAAGISF